MNIVRTRLLFLFLLSVGIAPSRADELPTDAWRAMGKGEVWLRELPPLDSHGRQFEATAMMYGTVDEVERVLVDYTRYPEFMPNMARTDISFRDARESHIDCTLALPMGLEKKYRLAMMRRTIDGGVELAWRKIPWPGLPDNISIRDTQGAWRITVPPGFPGQVLLRYKVYTDPGDIPFGMGWIAEWLAKRGVPDVVEKTRARVRQMRERAR